MLWGGSNEVVRDEMGEWNKQSNQALFKFALGLGHFSHDPGHSILAVANILVRARP